MSIIAQQTREGVGWRGRWWLKASLAGFSLRNSVLSPRPTAATLQIHRTHRRSRGGRGGRGRAEDFAGLMLIVVRGNLRTRKPVSSGAQERMHTRCPLLCPPRVPAGGDKSRRRAASFCSAGICSALPCERAAKSNPRLILCFEPGYLQAFELRVLRRSSWV